MASSRNESSSYDELLDRMLDEMKKLPYIHRKDIPNIDLYMDQVTTLIEERLAPTRRTDQDKILTKTMINNYAKNKLLPPPKGKKYSREHLILLILIYYFKGFLSLQDIRSLTDPLIRRHTQAGSASDLAEIFHLVFSGIEQQVENVREDMHAHVRESSKLFPDSADEDQDFLQYFSLVCMIGADIYIRKRLMENLIDAYSEAGEKNDSRSKNKEKKKE